MFFLVSTRVQNLMPQRNLQVAELVAVVVVAAAVVVATAAVICFAAVIVILCDTRTVRTDSAFRYCCCY